MVCPWGSYPHFFCESVQKVPRDLALLILTEMNHHRNEVDEMWTRPRGLLASLYKARITGQRNIWELIESGVESLFLGVSTWGSLTSVLCSFLPFACLLFTHQPKPGTNKQPDPVIIQSVEHRVCYQESGDQRSEEMKRKHATAERPPKITRSYR